MTSPCFQVEVVTKAPSNGGSAIEIHRYMAAGSCIGVEVWQPSDLLGDSLEAELTSLVCASIALSVKCSASEAINIIHDVATNRQCILNLEPIQSF